MDALDHFFQRPTTPNWVEVSNKKAPTIEIETNHAL
jgi:hypothetical protein